MGYTLYIKCNSVTTFYEPLNVLLTKDKIAQDKKCCRFNRKTVKDGFKAVKGDELNAFIYDATVLEYLVGQDDECNVLTVGSWYAMTGYGVAFPKNSMWVPKFNEYLMRYRENGDLERMQRFWFTGACEPRKRRRTSSKPLALAQVLDEYWLSIV